MRESRYKERLLIEEFKKGMIRMIRRKLIEVERPPTNIEQWYKYTTNLDSVVATTCQNGTRDMLTSAKLLVGYLVVGITRELDKEPSLY